MALLKGNVRQIYFRYLGAAFGSALISSIYGPVSYTHLAPALKHALFGLMNADILSGGQHHSVAYAMERLVQSLRTGMEKGGALALPKLLAWQPHGYE